MLNRATITDKLREALEPLPFIYAFWLEGADANSTADEYSDIDFWVDFEDEYEEKAYEAVENTLSELAELDYKYVKQHGHPQIRQRAYHLSGTSEYLMIDFCLQLHSRSKDEYAFYENNNIESARVLFDKKNIIRYKPLDLAVFSEQNRHRFEEAKYRRAQLTRVERYIHRKQYLEALDKYNCFILESLVDLLRLIYTPAHADYSFIHISQHVPAAEREQLEYFARISSLDDIAKKIPQAAQWFDTLAERVNI